MAKPSKRTIRMAIAVAEWDNVRLHDLSESERMERYSEAPKLGADGTITYKGQTLGSVVKTREGTSIYSVISKNDGPVRWIPRNADGEPILGSHDFTGSGTVRTQDEAIQIVIEYAAPTRVEVTDNGSGRWGRWEATINVKGGTLCVSRSNYDVRWHAHYIRTAGAFLPRLSTVPSATGTVLTDPELISMVNAAANANGAAFTS